ncbi:MAG: cbb3-type cytochrome c oxidase subunit 3 [Idiomarina sp.]|nr:cbb3-type cytochrome c oxidase subunit 3 [Idiomarina sp.]
MGGPSFHAWYTLLVFGVILVVIFWAYRPKNKERFNDIAKSVIDEDTPDAKEDNSRRKQESNSDE